MLTGWIVPLTMLTGWIVPLTMLTGWTVPLRADKGEEGLRKCWTPHKSSLCAVL